ncbi:hypothetical protein SAMN05421760_10396 [Neptunomonas antarctica]|uniref:Uncharacterized protein n=2 Tax=Neptunomonas antarctica TaxID=619304 RepID=A0A1N7L023_9GAMM|nr:hypothetical protein SAMN05421760_10396 [Neptunomonas antarctica]
MMSGLSGAAMALPQSQSNNNSSLLPADRRPLMADTLAKFEARTIEDLAVEEQESTKKGVKCLFYNI